MGSWVTVIKSNENSFIWNKCTVDEWIWQLFIWHSIVVEVQKLTNFDLALLNFLEFALFLAKNSHSKFAIVKVCACKKISLRILLNLFDFDELIVVTSDVLLKCYWIVL